MDSIEKNFKDLVKYLSKLIISKKVPIIKNKEQIIEIFRAYTKIYTLKGLADPLQIYHILEEHQNSNLKLECGTAHCIECYNYFCNDANWDPNNTFCTCERKIVPKYRSSIIKNYERIQGLKEICTICAKSKDKMNFAVISRHPCKACTECIKENYKYEKGFVNKCPLCPDNYDEESELIIRSIVEESIKDEDKARFYAGQCYDCKQEKDSRTFIEICGDNHKICPDCLKKVDKAKGNCACGLPLSNIQ